MALFFGGNTETIVPLLIMTLKVAVVSLASITVFSGLDPDRLANGMLWFGCPGQLSFSISFAYRILPVLMEEFQNILLSYRLRGNPPSKNGLAGKIRYLAYQIRMIIQGVLSADAQYGEAFQNDRGSAGTQGIPPFDPESGSEENEAGHAESDPGGPHFCMHFHCLGMRKLRRVGSAVDPRRRVETGISFFTGRMNKEA